MSQRKLMFDFGSNLFTVIDSVDKLGERLRKNRVYQEELKSKLKEYKKELKELEKQEDLTTEAGRKKYDAMIGKILDVEQTIKTAKVEQRELNKQFQELNLPEGSMARFRAETTRMQKQLNAMVVGVNASQEEFDELADKVAKAKQQIIDFDLGINDGRTNVGRYTESIKRVGVGFDQLLGVAAGVGGALSGAFVFDAVIGQISSFNEEIRQIADEQYQVQLSFRGTNEELKNMRADISATSTVLQTDYLETLNAANQLTERFGTGNQRAIDLVTRGLDNVKDKSGFLGLVNEELRKFVDLGVDDESAIALLTQASNLGINPDIFAEPLIKLREATPATVDALVNAFGEEKTNEIFKTFETKPLEAIQMISDGMNNLGTRSSETGALLADVFSSSGEDDVAMALNLQNIETTLGEVTERTQAQLDVQREYEQALGELSEEMIGVSDDFKLMKDRIAVLLVQGLLSFFDIIKAVPGFLRKNRVTIGALIIALIAFNANLIKSNALALRDVALKNLQAITTARTTAAQWLFNAALTANPIGIVIGLVAGLIAVLAFLYNNFDSIVSILTNLSNRFLEFYDNNLLVRMALFAIVEPIKLVVKFFRGASAGTEAFQLTVQSVVTSVLEWFNRLGLSAERLGKRIQLGLTVNPSKRTAIRGELKNIEKEFEESRKRVAEAEAKLDAVLEAKKKKKQQSNDDANKVGTGTGTQTGTGGSTGSADGNNTDGSSNKKDKEAAAKKAEQEAKARAKREADAQKKIEDLKVATMADGTAKRIAQLRLRAKRELEQIKVGGDQKKELETLIEKRLKDDIAKVNNDAAKKKADEEKKAEEERLRKEEEALNKKLETLETGFEKEKTLLLEQRQQGVIDEEAFNEQLLEKQIKLAEDKVEAQKKGTRAEYEARQELANLLIQQAEELHQKELEGIEDKYNDLIDAESEKVNERVNALREQYLNDEISYDEYLMRLKDLEDEHQAYILEQKIAAEEEKLKLAAEGSDEQKAILDNLQGLNDEYYKLQIDQHKRFEEEKTRVSKEQQKNRLEVSKAGLDFLNTLSDLQLELDMKRAGKNEAEQRKAQRKAAIRGKVLASAQASINTFEAVTKAMASAPPPFGQILAAIALAQGLAQVALINAKPLPELYGGGYRMGRRVIARGQETSGGYYPHFPTHSDGGALVEMAQGEMAVTPRADTPRGRSLVSFVNALHGGVRYPGTSPLPPELDSGIKNFLMDGSVSMPASQRPVMFNPPMSLLPKAALGGSSSQFGNSQLAKEMQYQNALLAEQNQLMKQQKALPIDPFNKVQREQQEFDFFGEP